MRSAPLFLCWSLASLLTLLPAGCQPGEKPQPQAATETLESGEPETGEPETGAETPAAAEDQGSHVDLERIRLVAPEGWERKPASSGFVAAEFTLPRAAGDSADGRLTVSIAGGSIDANIERWKSQFGNQPRNEARKELEIEGLPVTRVDLAGEFHDQRGPVAAAGGPQAGYRLIGFIIPVEETLHFVKAVGPEKTIEARAEEIESFVRSVRRNRP